MFLASYFAFKQIWELLQDVYIHTGVLRKCLNKIENLCEHKSWLRATLAKINKFTSLNQIEQNPFNEFMSANNFPGLWLFIARNSYKGR